MKSKIVLLIMLAVISISVTADDYEKIRVLKEKKIAIDIQMHHKRIEIIKKNPSLQELQKKIIALHKELAIRVENNEEMRKLVNKLRDIETKIRSIEGGKNKD